MSAVGKVLRSSGVLLALRTLQRSLGVISTLILARLLVPEDFGIIAIAMLVVSFSNIICMTGAPEFVARADTVSDALLDTAWTFDVLLKTGVAVLLLISLPAIHRVWSNGEATATIACLLPSIILVSLRNPELMLDARNLDYRRFMQTELVGKVAGFVVTVSLAITIQSHWAIVAGHYASGVGSVLASWAICKYRATPSLANVKEQWHFSRWMMGRGGLGFLRAQIDVLFVSRVFPLPQFGAFTLAREISVMPVSDIINPATTPLLATFSRVKKMEDELRRQLCVSLTVISGAVAPLCVFLALQSDEVVTLLFGKKWIEAGPLLQAMSPLLFGFSFGTVLNFLLIARGRYKALFVYDAMSLVIVALLLVSQVDKSLQQVVWLRGAAAVALTCGALAYFARDVALPARRTFTTVLIPLVLAFAAYYPASLIEISSPWGVLANGVAFSFAYVLAVAIALSLARSRGTPYSEIFSFCAETLQRLAKRRS